MSVCATTYSTSHRCTTCPRGKTSGSTNQLPYICPPTAEQCIACIKVLSLCTAEQISQLAWGVEQPQQRNIYSTTRKNGDTKLPSCDGSTHRPHWHNRFPTNLSSRNSFPEKLKSHLASRGGPQEGSSKKSRVGASLLVYLVYGAALFSSPRFSFPTVAGCS